MWSSFGFRERVKESEVNDQLFDDLDLTLFRIHKRRTWIFYFVTIWGMTGLKVVMLVSDMYTCIKLLAFNTWSNAYVQPFLPFKISKWLFSSCIMLSILLVFWDLVAGLRMYKGRNVVHGYVNNVARSIYCLRDSRVYCLFDKVTPCGAFQRATFFSFFELKSCLRLLLTDSPRQAINGLTLWSVLSGDAMVVTNSGNAPSSQSSLYTSDSILHRLKALSHMNREEAAILSLMLMSFTIWTVLFSKLCCAALTGLYVSYRFVRDPGRQFKSLREYIYVTVSYNLEYLSEKYRYKQLYSRTSLLEQWDTDSGSENELEKQCPKIYDDPKLYDDKYAEMYGAERYTDLELGQVVFARTPDTLESIPSYYYRREDPVKAKSIVE